MVYFSASTSKTVPEQSSQHSPYKTELGGQSAEQSAVADTTHLEGILHRGIHFYSIQIMNK